MDNHSSCFHEIEDLLADISAFERRMDISVSSIETLLVRTPCTRKIMCTVLLILTSSSFKIRYRRKRNKQG